jgi:electron transport complex protein RnfA
MDVKTVILLILAGVLANNYAFEKFLGLTPLLGWAKKGQKLLVMGLAVAIVTLLATAILWPLQNLVLAPLGLEFLSLLCAVAVILVLVYLLGAIFKKSFGAFFPLVALNSVVLGMSVEAASLSYIEALLAALGVGLGFLAALFLMSGVERRIQPDRMPKAFRGLPGSLLAAGIISMALLAFK